MYPKHHALISGLAAASYAALTGLALQQVAVWTVIGMFAGVFIDVDHAVLAVMFGKRDVVWDWMHRPVTALVEPARFVADIEYGGPSLYYHRIISHLVILAVVVFLARWYALFVPVMVALVAHIAADIAWDLHHGNYGPPS